MSQKTSLARRLLWGCWLAVIAALAASPPLRQLALEQSRLATPLSFSGEVLQPDGLPRSIRPASISILLPHQERQRPQKDAQAWARRYPENIVAQIEAQIALGEFGWYSSPETRRALDSAIARVPDAAWLYAARLRYTFGEFPSLGDSLVDWDSTTEYRSNKAVKLPDAAQIAASLEVARRGSEMEPDNGFFDYCAALLHIQQKRPDLAIRALESAGRKKDFNEHVLEETRARIENKRYQSPQTFEREVAMASSVVLPHYSPMREGARRFVGEAKRLEARGDHAQALRISGAVLSLGRSMSRGNNLLMTSLVGRAIQSIAVGRGLKAPTNVPPTPGQDTGEVIRSMRLAAFVKYAKSHGRDDLAADATKDAQINKALTTAQLEQSDAQTMGVPSALMDRTNLMWRIGAALLLQIALGLAVIALTSTWRRRSRSEASASGIDVACAALPPIVAAATCGWMAWQIKAPGFSQGFSSETGSAVSAMILLSWGIALAPVLLVPVWCVAGALVAKKRRRREAAFSPRRVTPATSQGESRAPSELFQRVGSAVLGLGWLIVAALGWLWAADAHSLGSVMPWLFATELASVLALHIYLKRRMSFVPGDTNETAFTESSPARHALERARRALCWTTALAALSWIALTTSSLPVRAQAQAHLDAYLQKGEVAALYERAGLVAALYERAGL